MFDPQLYLPDKISKLDLAEIYGDEKPLIVELGSGKGGYLIRLAEQDTTHHYLAVEYASKYFRIMKYRVTRRNLKHFRVCRTEAAELVTHGIPDNSVAAFHIYHPDPWPKKRHNRRRLIQDPFCETLRRKMRDDGKLYFQTDHAEYWEAAVPCLEKCFNIELHPEPWEDAPEGRTNYEFKYLVEGRKIWRLIATKK